MSYNQTDASLAFVTLGDMKYFEPTDSKPFIVLKALFQKARNNPEQLFLVEIEVTRKKYRKILKSLEREICNGNNYVEAVLKIRDLTITKTGCRARLKSICAIELDGRRLNLDKVGEPELVFIDSQSPDYNEIKFELKKRGFRWNRDRRAWERRAFLKDLA